MHCPAVIPHVLKELGSIDSDEKFPTHAALEDLVFLWA